MNRAALQRAAVRRLTEALSRHAQMHQVNQIVVEEAVLLCNASSVALCMLLEGSGQLDFVAVAGELVARAQREVLSPAVFRAESELVHAEVQELCQATRRA